MNSRTRRPKGNAPAPAAAKGSGRDVGAASRPVASGVVLDGGVLRGRVPEGPLRQATLALVSDGRVHGAVVAAADGAFALTVPASLGGLALDVLAVPSGASVLAAPVVAAGIGRVAWKGWAFRDGRIEGRFALGAGSAGAPHVLVEARDVADPHQVYLQTFAVPDAEGDYRFDAPLRRLVRMGVTVTLAPRVSGAALEERLALSSSDIGRLGHVDTTDATALRGWAVDLGDRTRRLRVEVRAGNETIGTAEASDSRADLAALGLSDGHSGFTVPIPPTLDRTCDQRLSVFVAGTELELIDSPATLPALPPVIGYFDAVEGPFAGGWAVNMIDPKSPLEVQAVCGGEVIGSGLANLYRGDVENAGLPTAWCGFRFLLDRPLVTLFGRDIELRVVGADTAIGGSPRQISQNENIRRFLTRSDAVRPASLQRLIHRMTRQTAGTMVSIVMPIYDTPIDWLIEALNSVLAQWSANWELICVDDASPNPEVGRVLTAAALHDPRVHVIRLGRNVGIAAATNAGIKAATGDYVTFVDHDDVIEPDAVHKLGLAAQTTGADMIYSDEAVTTDDIGSIIEVRARPAFSHDYYLSHPYFVHMVCVRTALAQEIGGWDESLDISADVDFILRVIEQARAIAHVPAVLYRWRTHETSAGHAKMGRVTEAMTGLLARHLDRLGRTATVQPGLRYNEYRVDWPDDGGEVMIVIPTKNRVDLLKPCIDSIEATCGPDGVRIVVIDHQSNDPATIEYLEEIGGRHTVMPYRGVFNYALMNNLAVKTHGGSSPYYLFLNNDVEAFEPSWLARLRSLAGRADVGAVGPLLLYGDKRVQHAGVLMGFAGAADHAMKFHAAYLGEGKRHPGYNCNLTTVRDYSAVTAACVMIPARVFQQVNGFDERFIIGFNDTDLCLRIIEAGYKVLYDGFTVLYHHESATRTQNKAVDHPEDDARLRERWGRYLREGDPFYSPLLAPRGTDHTLRQDAGCKGRAQPRVITLDHAAMAKPVEKTSRRPRSVKPNLRKLQPVSRS